VHALVGIHISERNQKWTHTMHIFVANGGREPAGGRGNPVRNDDPNPRTSPTGNSKASRKTISLIEKPGTLRPPLAIFSATNGRSRTPMLKKLDIQDANQKTTPEANRETTPGANKGA
jgi:hypothetical protein